MKELIMFIYTQETGSLDIEKYNELVNRYNSKEEVKYRSIKLNYACQYSIDKIFRLREYLEQQFSKDTTLKVYSDIFIRKISISILQKTYVYSRSSIYSEIEMILDYCMIYFLTRSLAFDDTIK